MRNDLNLSQFNEFEDAVIFLIHSHINSNFVTCQWILIIDSDDDLQVIQLKGGRNFRGNTLCIITWFEWFFYDGEKSQINLRNVFISMPLFEFKKKKIYELKKRRKKMHFIDKLLTSSECLVLMNEESNFSKCIPFQRK